MITLRDRIVEAVAIGVSAGACGAALTYFIKFGGDAAAALSFLGAFAGAAATILGAVWLADRNEKSAHRRETAILLEAIPSLIRWSSAVSDILHKPNVADMEVETAIHPLRTATSDAAWLFQEATETAQTLDFVQRAKVKQANAAIARFSGLHRRRFGQPSASVSSIEWQEAALDIFSTAVHLDQALQGKAPKREQ